MARPRFLRGLAILLDLAKVEGTHMAEASLTARKIKPPAPNWRVWLGVLPFFLFAILFLLLPSARLFIGSFTDASGRFTLGNLVELFKQPNIINSYLLSIQISAITALGGGILGFLLAYSVTIGGLPKQLRSALITFSGVASNFAGVPLAFAFIATLGRTGFITAMMKTYFHVNIYDHGFNLYSFVGLALTYMYFQFPLMVLIMAPALDGLKREWREAAENLGASSSQYWLRVALPILLPSILGSMILLFGNAFGAYATAYALTGGALPIVTIQIGAQIRGDVLHNPGLGYAMAMGMVIIMAVSLAGYSWLQGRTERWLR
jgi:putative spermidine/putrescine transport system permease protein